MSPDQHHEAAEALLKYAERMQREDDDPSAASLAVAHAHVHAVLATRSAQHDQWAAR